MQKQNELNFKDLYRYDDVLSELEDITFLTNHFNSYAFPLLFFLEESVSYTLRALGINFPEYPNFPCPLTRLPHPDFERLELATHRFIYYVGRVSRENEIDRYLVTPSLLGFEEFLNKRNYPDVPICRWENRLYNTYRFLFSRLMLALDKRVTTTRPDVKYYLLALSDKHLYMEDLPAGLSLSKGYMFKTDKASVEDRRAFFKRLFGRDYDADIPLSKDNLLTLGSIPQCLYWHYLYIHANRVLGLLGGVTDLGIGTFADDAKVLSILELEPISRKNFVNELFHRADLQDMLRYFASDDDKKTDIKEEIENWNEQLKLWAEEVCSNYDMGFKDVNNRPEEDIYHTKIIKDSVLGLSSVYDIPYYVFDTNSSSRIPKTGTKNFGFYCSSNYTNPLLIKLSIERDLVFRRLILEANACMSGREEVFKVWNVENIAKAKADNLKVKNLYNDNKIEVEVASGEELMSLIKRFEPFIDMHINITNIFKKFANENSRYRDKMPSIYFRLEENSYFYYENNKNKNNYSDYSGDYFMKLMEDTNSDFYVGDNDNEGWKLSYLNCPAFRDEEVLLNLFNFCLHSSSMFLKDIYDEDELETLEQYAQYSSIHNHNTDEDEDEPLNFPLNVSIIYKDEALNDYYRSFIVGTLLLSDRLLLLKNRDLFFKIIEFLNNHRSMYVYDDTEYEEWFGFGLGVRNIQHSYKYNNHPRYNSKNPKFIFVCFYIRRFIKAIMWDMDLVSFYRDFPVKFFEHSGQSSYIRACNAARKLFHLERKNFAGTTYSPLAAVDI